MNIFSNPSGSIRPATADERHAWLTAISYFQSLELPDILAPSENKKVIFINFDGTGNNVDTNPAEDSNVGALSQLLKQVDSGSEQIESRYIEGIGTTGAGQTLQQMLATGAAELLQRAMNHVRTIVAQNPADTPYIVVTGFSRGAALARAFMSLIHDYGIPGAEDPSTNLIYDTSTAQKPPGSVHMSAILFDTVTTGMGGYDYSVPPTVDSLVHLTSRDEQREMFGLTSVLGDPGKPQIGSSKFSYLAFTPTLAEDTLLTRLLSLPFISLRIFFKTGDLLLHHPSFLISTTRTIGKSTIAAPWRPRRGDGFSPGMDEKPLM